MLRPLACPERASLDQPAALWLDARLRRLGREEARGRRRLGEIASVFQRRRSWLDLGFVRLGDWARERLGLSGSELEAAARVATGLRRLPRIAEAFEAGDISWTKVRLLVTVAAEATEESWLQIARRETTRRIEETIRHERDTARAGGAAEDTSAGDQKPLATSAPDGARLAAAEREVAISREENGEEVDGEARVKLRLAVPRPVRVLFRRAVELARRSLGGPTPLWHALEAIAAEASSAPAVVDLPERAGPCNGDRPERPKTTPLGEHRAGSCDDLPPGLAETLGLSDEEIRDLAPPSEGPPQTVAATDFRTLDAPPLLGGNSAPLDDPRDLDRSMRVAVAGLRHLDWKVGRLLSILFERELHRRILGYDLREDYVHEALGISTRKAQALLALDRACRRSATLGRAYRSGEISWVRALAILPVIEGAPEDTAAAWAERARQVTVRRLIEEVAWVLDRRDLGIESKTRGEPPDLGAKLEPVPLAALGEAQMRDGASTSDAALSKIQLSGPASVIALFRATLVAWTFPRERAWQGLERMLLHVLQEWRQAGRHRDPVFERHGWRCAVPACSSMRELHDHHLRFRSRGGGNEIENRAPVCLAHHQYGIHQGRVRAAGKAPGAILWELGTGDGREPFLVLRGDVYVEREPRGPETPSCRTLERKGAA